MKTLNKLQAYREALSSFSAGKLAGYHTLEEPKPEEFGLRSEPEKFMAAKIREEHFRKK